MKTDNADAAEDISGLPTSIPHEERRQGHGRAGRSGPPGNANARTHGVNTLKRAVRELGGNSHMPPVSGTKFFEQDARVTVQLVNDATPTCWTSEFNTATVNEGERFKARTP